MDTLNFTATCLFGLEKFVGEEIDALGYKRTETFDGRVHFTGDINAIARANINLRCAERVLINLGSFRADTFDELFEGTRALPWEEFIGSEDAFPVKGHSIKSKLTSIPDCQKIIKKAIVERLRDKHGVIDLPEDCVKYQIEFFILNDNAALMIDTSGTPLHKRGYRPQAGAAPLRETLAAAMVKLARPREEVLLWDPFCGSGTIPIEAALIMTNTAPGLFRNFSSEDFPFVPYNSYDLAIEEANDNIKPSKFEAYASDIDPACVEIARANIKRAGMGDNVHCFERDALVIAKDGRRGTIVTNPPYGERLLTPEETEELYIKMGRHFKSLDPWQIYIISSCENFEDLYGRKADKIRRLYNGMIRCNYYQFFRRKDKPQA